MTYDINITNIREKIEEFMKERGMTKEDIEICYICVHATWYQIDFDELLLASEKANTSAYNGSYPFKILFKNGYSISLLNTECGDGMVLKYETMLFFKENIHKFLDIEFDNIISEIGHKNYIESIEKIIQDLIKNFPDDLQDHMHDYLLKYFIDKFQL